jgi:catechol 2,3-dioxygenase-like lactoylglutathione lyase family enzyme
MLEHCRWLALEVKDTEAARDFYETHLDLATVGDATELAGPEDHDAAVALGLGGPGPGTALVLRRPAERPRGGLHTHYALSIPAAEYSEWWDRLGATFDLEEHQFGSISSLYFYDLAGNCVELAQSDVAGPGVDGVFEVVLEVASIERAESFYADLGFEPIDRQHDRVRLRGPVDLELWEPRLGLAGARGGVHVDLGFGTADPARAVAAVEDRIAGHEDLEEGIRVEDPDGHFLTFV